MKMIKQALLLCALGFLPTLFPSAGAGEPTKKVVYLQQMYVKNNNDGAEKLIKNCSRPLEIMQRGVGDEIAFIRNALVHDDGVKGQLLSLCGELGMVLTCDSAVAGVPFIAFLSTIRVESLVARSHSRSGHKEFDASLYIEIDWNVDPVKDAAHCESVMARLAQEHGIDRPWARAASLASAAGAGTSVSSGSSAAHASAPSMRPLSSTSPSVSPISAVSPVVSAAFCAQMSVHITKLNVTSGEKTINVSCPRTPLLTIFPGGANVASYLQTVFTRHQGTRERISGMIMPFPGDAEALLHDAGFVITVQTVSSVAGSSSPHIELKVTVPESMSDSMTSDESCPQLQAIRSLMGEGSVKPPVTVSPSSLEPQKFAMFINKVFIAGNDGVMRELPISSELNWKHRFYKAPIKNKLNDLYETVSYYCKDATLNTFLDDVCEKVGKRRCDRYSALNCSSPIDPHLEGTKDGFRAFVQSYQAGWHTALEGSTQEQDQKIVDYMERGFLVVAVDLCVNEVTSGSAASISRSAPSASPRAAFTSSTGSPRGSRGASGASSAALSAAQRLDALAGGNIALKVGYVAVGKGPARRILVPQAGPCTVSISCNDFSTMDSDDERVKKAFSTPAAMSEVTRCYPEITALFGSYFALVVTLIEGNMSSGSVGVNLRVDGVIPPVGSPCVAVDMSHMSYAQWIAAGGTLPPGTSAVAVPRSAAVPSAALSSPTERLAAIRASSVAATASSGASATTAETGRAPTAVLPSMAGAGSGAPSVGQEMVGIYIHELFLITGPDGSTIAKPIPLDAKALRFFLRTRGADVSLFTCIKEIVETDPKIREALDNHCKPELSTLEPELGAMQVTFVNPVDGRELWGEHLDKVISSYQPRFLAKLKETEAADSLIIKALEKNKTVVAVKVTFRKPCVIKTKRGDVVTVTEPRRTVAERQSTSTGSGGAAAASAGVSAADSSS